MVQNFQLFKIGTAGMPEERKRFHQTYLVPLPTAAIAFL